MVSHLRNRDRLLQTIDRFAGRKLLVVGDLIADQFLYGRIARVSREAPVLVLEYRDMVRVPGGAANAANNLLDLGCSVSLVGAVGYDEAGRELTAALRTKGADIRHVVRLKSYSTPVKTRILAGAHHSSPQQVVRVDRESQLAGGLTPPWRGSRRYFDGIEGIIVSDYGYGAAGPALCDDLRVGASKRGIPLVADSRFRVQEFHGITSMTPNITELEAAVGTAVDGDPTLFEKAARRVLRKQDLASLLVTQGRFGMTLMRPRRKPLHIPIFGTDEVADVTGAGDTVIAVFTLALACGAAPEDGARLANYAGGIVVMKRGTATVRREELAAAVRLDFSR
jgi:rfaE bifunctional protein kinase chain/domain